MATVICQTEGCENSGIPIEIATSWTDEDGQTHAVAGIVCGPCGAALDPEPEQS